MNGTQRRALVSPRGVGQAHVNYIMYLRDVLNISREQILSLQNINEKVQRGF